MWGKKTHNNLNGVKAVIKVQLCFIISLPFRPFADELCLFIVVGIFRGAWSL